ncbi:MAG: hypothetical protein AAEI08_02800, partial [Gammaproteobacteria bacterium]
MSSWSCPKYGTNWMCLGFLPLILIGCGGGGETESTADSVSDMETKSPFVEVLPGYESELLPE